MVHCILMTLEVLKASDVQFKALYLKKPFGAAFQYALRFATLLETAKSVLQLAANLGLDPTDNVEIGAIERRELKSSVGRALAKVMSSCRRNE